MDLQANNTPSSQSINVDLLQNPQSGSAVFFFVSPLFMSARAQMCTEQKASTLNLRSRSYDRFN